MNPTNSKNPTNPIHVPILDLTRQYETIKPEIDAAVARVLASGRFILGPEVETFEQGIAEYCGVNHAIGVASGTDALLLSLRALGIGPGDSARGIARDGNIPRAKVIVPSFTFFATAGVVYNVSATPVFCDIDPKTFNLDPAYLRELFTDHPSLVTDVKAIIPVHLYGQMADMDEIMALAEEYDLYVIEDAAQAIGAEYLPRAILGDEAISRGRKLHNSEPNKPYGLNEPNEPLPRAITTKTPISRGNELHELNELVSKAGTIGDLGCFSFFPTKNLGAYGDGGMIVTNDDALAEHVRILRVHGSKPKYYHRIVGVNSRLDALQAAILRVKLPHLSQWSQGRQEIASKYDEAFKEVDGIETPFRAENRSHIFHQYTIRVKDGRRDALQKHLKEQGIGTLVYYPLPLHLQECFQEFGYHKGDLPQSELASQQVLSLPIFPELTEKEQDYVVQAIKAFTKEDR